MAFVSNNKANHLPREAVHTLSLCPVCLKRIDAILVEMDGEVLLKKQCRQHGNFSTPVWRGSPSMKQWRRPKRPVSPGPGDRLSIHGCPFDCGLCCSHRQQSCTVLINVTQRCDLVCPVCFAASSTKGPPDPDLEELRRRFETVSLKSPGANIQLSGGEPTLRDDLPAIVALGKDAGFGFIQLNTNGIRLAQDSGYLKRLVDAGLDSIFFQFDGTHDHVYLKLRGQALLERKLETIAACGRENLGVVLVVTVVPGVNDHNLGAILKLAVEQTPVIRGVHFQPVSYFGRFPDLPSPENRITLPEVMRAIEAQTQGAFSVDQFSPSGCENAMCSFSGKFLVQPDLSVHSLLPAWQGCCGRPESAQEGALKSITLTARQWATVPQDDLVAAHAGVPIASSTEPKGKREMMDLDQFIHQVRTRTLAISAMSFQDAWSLDLERVQDCCIHVVDTQGRLIPFCLYNLTSVSGKRLYRP